MSDEKSDRQSNRLEAFGLLSQIATATTRLEALKLEFSTHALLWDLEVQGKLTRLDTDNLGVVFRVALEKRLYELAYL